MYRPALFAAALAVASAPVGAAVVYSQTPYKLVGATSDFSVDVGLNQQADNFQLTSASTIRGISFWGDRGALTPDDMFIIRIFADITDKPNTTPLSESLLADLIRTPTGESIAGSPVYAYSANLVSPFALNASTTYYLSIVNNTASTDPWSWSQLNGTVDNRRWHRAGGVSATDEWSETTSDLAFVLTDQEVPVPAPLALIAIGGLALAMIRRRRGSATTEA
ncbi:MAG: hypothetical protein N838_33235 [Thiohalocapsa sp. PB-PSB1]|jgi:hypothetical protein|nr:MAG: hypothetical protein N838_34845 [Thiohalocapsa sp. PB-PSB1]QQO55076.1 MAG: hypothetical protein N838_18750 [Thiohalocapsa sp. PB-PSB1]QQO57498.1 MAG: hypothetical protein N838_33235 [Thiohalocapsa sp. PB-PSB1]